MSHDLHQMLPPALGPFAASELEKITDSKYYFGYVAKDIQVKRVRAASYVLQPQVKPRKVGRWSDMLGNALSLFPKEKVVKEMLSSYSLPRGLPFFARLTRSKTKSEEGSDLEFFDIYLLNHLSKGYGKAVFLAADRFGSEPYPSTLAAMMWKRMRDVPCYKDVPGQGDLRFNPDWQSGYLDMNAGVFHTTEPSLLEQKSI